MISLQSVLDSIDEIEAMPDSYKKAEKLATFYTLRDALQGKVTEQYRAAPVQEVEYTIGYHSGTEFGSIVEGKDSEMVWPVIDELMDTLHIINPRLYDTVLNRLV